MFLEINQDYQKQKNYFCHHEKQFNPQNILITDNFLYLIDQWWTNNKFFEYNRVSSIIQQCYFMYETMITTKLQGC